MGDEMSTLRNGQRLIEMNVNSKNAWRMIVRALVTARD